MLSTERGAHEKMALVGGDGAQMSMAAGGTSSGRLEEPEHSTSNWYFTREEIDKNSPSRKDGIDLKRETYFRKSYCTFLQDLGMCLKVPQVTIATSIVFSHRFYLRRSHMRNDRFIIATVCMFLAGKVEETPRPLRDVIFMSYEIRHKKDPSALAQIKLKEVFDKQKDLVLVGERLVLCTLSFDLNIHHPYKPLVAAIKKFKVAQNALAQVAWNFVNDGLRTSLCLQFKPHHIAAGAIFLAAKFLKVKLPHDGDKVWWQEFEVTPRQLEEVSNQMLELYEQNKSGGANASRSSDPGSSSAAAIRNRMSELPSSNGHHSLPISSNAPNSQLKQLMKQEVREESNAGCVLEDGQIKEEHREKKLTSDVKVKTEAGVPVRRARPKVEADDRKSMSDGPCSRDRNEDAVDSKLGGEAKIDFVKLKSETEDEEPKKSYLTTLEDSELDRVKALAQKRRKSRGEGLDSKPLPVKVETTDSEELLERELENGVEVESERVKQERRDPKLKSSQKMEHDLIEARRERPEDGEIGSKRRRSSDEDVIEKKRVKSIERVDRSELTDADNDRGGRGVGSTSDRAEDGELPASSHLHEQSRSPRQPDRRPVPSASHEKNASPSSKRYRDPHGRRENHRDSRGIHGSRERDYHQRDHHYQHRVDGDRERVHHKERDYQERDHKKPRVHDISSVS